MADKKDGGPNGAWQRWELFAGALLLLMIFFGVFGVFGVWMGWWDTPDPGVDPAVNQWHGGRH